MRSKLLLTLILSLSSTSVMAKEQIELFSLKLIEDIINGVFGKNTVEMFVSGAMSIAGSLNGLAMSLAGILALVAILWGLLFAILEQKSVFSPTMETLIFSVLTVLLLGNYEMIVRDVVNLGQKTLEATGSSVGQAFTNFVHAFVTVFVKLFDQAISRIDLSWDFFKVAIEVIISLVFLVIAAIFVFIALIELVSVFLLGPVALGIGVALGPLFVATLPWQVSRGWLKKWVDFLITAAMVTAIAVIVMTLIQNVLVETVKLIGATGEGGGTIGRVVAFALISASMSKIFANIPAFADALFPGRASIGGAMGRDGGSNAAAAKMGGWGASVAGGAAGAAAGRLAAAAMASRGDRKSVV